MCGYLYPSLRHISSKLTVACSGTKKADILPVSHTKDYTLRLKNDIVLFDHQCSLYKYIYTIPILNIEEPRNFCNDLFL